MPGKLLMKMLSPVVHNLLDISLPERQAKFRHELNKQHNWKGPKIKSEFFRGHLKFWHNIIMSQYHTGWVLGDCCHCSLVNQVGYIAMLVSMAFLESLY